MRPLMWVSKSQEKLADELVALGHDVSPNTVGRLLVDELAYSGQVNRKTHEGSSHPDRNAQFEHINAQVKAAQAAGQPVICVDTKKKELIGNFRNSGSDYRPKGCPIDVNMHDFKDKERKARSSHTASTIPPSILIMLLSRHTKTAAIHRGNRECGGDRVGRNETKPHGGTTIRARRDLPHAPLVPPAQCSRIPLKRCSKKQRDGKNSAIRQSCAQNLFRQ